MRAGHLGGGFFTIWAPCPESLGEDPGSDFMGLTHGLRDSIEILDLIQNMIKQHPEFLQFARSSKDIMNAFNNGRIASLLAIEGSHVLGTRFPPYVSSLNLV
jgi:membrane dipeptidase